MRKPLALALATALAAVATALAPAPAAAGPEDDLRDGDRLFEAGEWARAATAFDRAIAKAPGQVSAEAYGKRAAIFIIVKDLRGGLAFVERAKARFPTATEVLEQEALLLWEADRRAEAIAVAERVVAARPHAFTNQKLIGESYASRDPVKTAAAYEAYLQHRPRELESSDAVPRLRLGFAYLANARTAIASGDDRAAQGLFGRAAEQFGIVQRKHRRQPNAELNADNGLCAAYTGQGRFDEAVAVCERVTTASSGSAADPTGAAWFNLGTAYLARKQAKKARAAAVEFIKVRRTEPRGFMLAGDTYFAERDWSAALEQYLRAEKLGKARPYEQVQLSIRLGKTYRRLPASAPGAAASLDLAIDKLASALVASPTSAELAAELGGAYLEARQDAKAAAVTERVLRSDPQPPPEQRASLLVVAGKAQFNQRKLREARQRFEAAQVLRPADVTIRRALVLVINEQAFDAGKDLRAAQLLLEQARTVDPESPVTITNLAVLALERGDCEGARKELAQLAETRGHDAVTRSRLLGRSYLCGARPDPRRAAVELASAEREAKKANATLALAEIYTEWAPLTWDADPAGAVEKLELAVQASAQDADLGEPARRNLALALFRRGWKQLRDNRPAEAAADFERALRDPSVLRGTEPLAFELSSALALLDSGRPSDAARLLRALAAKGNQAAYLKAPFAKIGGAFFAAYGAYRAGPAAARQQAVLDFARLQGEATGAFADRLRELIASAWELIAYDQGRAGQTAAAARSLANAERGATAEARRRIALNRAVLTLGRGGLAASIAALEAMGGAPPEALVSLGILYEQAGRPRDAYDAWVRARARGVVSRDLSKWIDAKKRNYGFGGAP